MTNPDRSFADLAEPRRRIQVKICGITNQCDGEAALEYGADVLGFNLWRGSKRYLDIRRESGWITNLPASIKRVAVMVNPSFEEAEAVFALPFIDQVQFHGDEGIEFCTRFGENPKAFIKAFALRDASSGEEIEGYRTPYVLLDAYAPGVFGGTGKTIDWELASEFVRSHGNLKVLLSGGLNPENVAEAIEKVQPYGVDVASGVELKPGRKDHAKMKAFVSAARGAGV